MKAMLKLTTDASNRWIAGLAIGASLFSAAAFNIMSESTTKATYIIQGPSLIGVKSAVAAVGGEITHELGVIRAVGARLTTDSRRNYKQPGRHCASMTIILLKRQRRKSRR